MYHLKKYGLHELCCISNTSVCVRVLCAHRVVPGFPTSDKPAFYSPLQHLGWWIATLETQNEGIEMKEAEKKTRQVGNDKRRKTRGKEGEQMRIVGSSAPFFGECRMTDTPFPCHHHLVSMTIALGP